MPRDRPLRALPGDGWCAGSSAPRVSEMPLLGKSTDPSAGHTLRMVATRAAEGRGEALAWARRRLTLSPTNKHLMLALWRLGTVLGFRQQMRLPCPCPHPAHGW